MFANEVLAKLRELAANDVPVTNMLDAYAAGAKTRDDIKSFAKMGPKTYRNARDRLGRLVEQLDQQTGAALRQA